MIRRRKPKGLIAGLFALSLLGLTGVTAGGSVQAQRERQQIPLPNLHQQEPSQPAVNATSITLVDVLSADPSYSLLIRLLQRSRLIPTLNRLNGSTLFAPVNDAIEQAAERELELEALEGNVPVAGRRRERGKVWSWALVEDGDDWDVMDGGDGPIDNVQTELRQTLLYHLLNYSLPYRTNSTTSIPYSPKSEMHETLLFPLPVHHPQRPGRPGSPPDAPPNQTSTTSLYQDQASRSNSASDPDKDKDQDPPGGGDWDSLGLLAGEGQRLRITQRAESGVGIKDGGGGVNHTFVGVDQFGLGGVKVVKPDVIARNGVVVGVGGVLERPNDLADTIKSHPSLKLLSQLLSQPSSPLVFLPKSASLDGDVDGEGPKNSLLDNLEDAPHLTLFLPKDEAWTAVGDLEWRYLTSGYAQSDLIEIFGNHASGMGVGKGKVGYMNRLVESKKGPKELPTISGLKVDVEQDSDGVVRVNGSVASETDVLASNGVIHVLDDILLPAGSLALTAEKYLLALNATKFVSLLRSANLSHYVQTSPESPTNNRSYTILAPRDDVLFDDSWSTHPRINQWDGGWTSLPPTGSEALRQVLQYHVVEGKLLPKDLEDGMLLGTELRSEKLLKGHRQRLSVTVTDSGDGSGDGGKKKKGKKGRGGGGDDDKNGNADIGFGNANVIAEPIVVGNSVIYLISQVLEPPTDLVTTAVSNLRLSTFVAAAYAAGLDKTFRRAPAVTYLVPENDAFSYLGLTMSYLLLPSSRDELRSVIQYHAIDEVVYLGEFPKGSRRYPTLGGPEIYVEGYGNGTLTVHGPTIGGYPANGEQRDSKIIEGDLLTSTGALHIMDQVELPPTLQIGIGKLMKGAKAGTMADLLRLTNFSWIMDGGEPPEDFVKARQGRNKVMENAQGGRSWTILCPTDKAFTRINLTRYLDDIPSLVNLVKLHIIPNPLDSLTTDPNDGKPLSITEEAAYPTLLSEKLGGGSAYGEVAFRSVGEKSWLVGIKGARGIQARNDWAAVTAWGRSTPRFEKENGEGPIITLPPVYDGDISTTSSPRSSSKVVLGGGVLMIDSVLIPYEPDWFYKWGYIVVLVVFLGMFVGLFGWLGYRIWTSRYGKNEPTYERLEGEED